MSKNSNTGLTPAKIYFNPQGTAISSQYDDIYFNTQDGLAETQYVFIQGNDLTQRFQALKQNQTLVIAETGFGSGLNFLASWQSFTANAKSDAKLHFISFEKYPLPPADIEQILQPWPQLKAYRQQLLAQYPKLLPGCHRLEFNQGRIILDLWFGDVTTTINQIYNPLQQHSDGIIDAWYLDGFAPSKNADMWQQTVFNGMARLGKKSCTFATFTCARQVKDGLTAAGFKLSKRKGFGHKREMLTGQLERKNAQAFKTPFYIRQQSPQNTNQTSIAIIGGGIAAASLCYALAKRGANITLYCKDNALAKGASQNRQGAFYPLLQADDNALTEFYAHSFDYAKRLYHQLINQNFTFQHQFCGVLIQAHDQKSQKQQQSLIDSGLWQSMYQAYNSQQASEKAKIKTPFSGLFIEDGGWINPASLIDALIQAAQTITQVTIKLNHQITELAPLQQQHQQVIIACGHLSQQFTQSKDLNLSSIRGQVSHLKATPTSKKLATVLCNSGYACPAIDDHHAIGASFIKNDVTTNLRDKEHQKNLERFCSGFIHNHPNKSDNPIPSWLNELAVPTEGRAAIRCASVDHMPLAGALPDWSEYQHSYQDLWKGLPYHCYPTPPDHQNLYILSGLGARGLCSAPLCAEIIAAQIYNQPYPASLRVLNALNPGREFIKRLKRKNG